MKLGVSSLQGRRVEGRREEDEPSRKVLKAMSLSARDLRVELKTASKTADGLPARRGGEVRREAKDHHGAGC